MSRSFIYLGILNIFVIEGIDSVMSTVTVTKPVLPSRGQSQQPPHPKHPP